jgi:hypothetical protein
MIKENSKRWQFDTQINLSVLIQLILLTSLIVGSWVNLQRQLDLLQRDVTMLIESNASFCQKFETLLTRSIEHEYRLQSLEKTVTKSKMETKNY